MRVCLAIGARPPRTYCGSRPSKERSPRSEHVRSELRPLAIAVVMASHTRQDARDDRQKLRKCHPLLAPQQPSCQARMVQPIDPSLGARLQLYITSAPSSGIKPALEQWASLLVILFFTVLGG